MDKGQRSRQTGTQVTGDQRSPDGLYHPWREPVRLFATVTPRGFMIEGHVYAELRGRVIETRFVRKFFLDTCLICYSPDAICAGEGFQCDGCDDTKCRPYLRIQLAYQSVIYAVDLGVSSAVNFVHMEEEALASGLLLIDVPIKLTVAKHGDGGEVRFECV